jgi:hypothetical protein
MNRPKFTGLFLFPRRWPKLPARQSNSDSQPTKSPQTLEIESISFVPHFPSHRHRTARQPCSWRRRHHSLPAAAPRAQRREPASDDSKPRDLHGCSRPALHPALPSALSARPRRRRAGTRVATKTNVNCSSSARRGRGSTGELHAFSSSGLQSLVCFLFSTQGFNFLASNRW